MDRPPKKMDVANMVNWTYYSRQYVDELIRHAHEVEQDARKDERLKAQECKSCFYRSRIGGAAMTTQPCMNCLDEQHFGSTNTDALCLECAKKHSLCKHCGGDIEMRVKRRKWPAREVEGPLPT